MKKLHNSTIVAILAVIAIGSAVTTVHASGITNSIELMPSETQELLYSIPTQIQHPFPFVINHPASFERVILGGFYQQNIAGGGFPQINEQGIVDDRVGLCEQLVNPETQEYEFVVNYACSENVSHGRVLYAASNQMATHILSYATDTSKWCFSSETGYCGSEYLIHEMANYCSDPEKVFKNMHGNIDEADPNYDDFVAIHEANTRIVLNSFENNLSPEMIDTVKQYIIDNPTAFPNGINC